MPPLTPSGSLLTLDPACKQYIVHVHSLTSHPPPKLAKSLKLYRSARMHLFVEHVQTDDNAMARLQKKMEKVPDYIDRHVNGSLSNEDPATALLPLSLYSYILDPLPTSNTLLLVAHEAVPGLVKVVEEWVEQSVWSRRGAEEEEEKKEGQKKRRRAPM